MNKFVTSQHKYNTLSDYFKNKYSSKVFKVSLDGGFTCPNRDGTISDKGCIYCSEKGSGEFAGNRLDSLRKQFEEIKNNILKKWPNSKYIVYFQSFTNTYAPLDKLKKLYEDAIKLDEKIVAISISTRPDCLSNEIIDYLNDLNKRIPVMIELGLQSKHEETNKYINRGYTLDVFTNAVKKLREKNIETIVHIINGLPNETLEDMKDTIKYINTLDIQGLKIHNLYVVKNSRLGKEYLKNPFPMLTLKEYVNIVTEQLAILDPKIIIHRINGDPKKEELIVPTWSLQKFIIMNEIDKEMIRKKYYQGINNK
ncbi:MAG: TIGR01212 family radical SAM protein [Bacilli bacterium]|nr:TIGR01212 family radical SAM protein [Bacilli bacterium]MDD3121246.1 TIGR01212 family radical SAM protein [Bacilli bacterium]MDD4062888.1 TIGR01212 family radical SAM protein [Bacilli bacterium]MDD4481939.1 TIGR01212 family radical SAM protein [Bacilli bacterium]MDD5182686.1 TIGR01212 family radical SAM protein [Bacilli bacterium]